MKNDETKKVNLNFSHSYFIFHNSDVYFVFIAKQELTDEKLFNFFLDLKKDLNKVCRYNLANLQDDEVGDHFYQRQLEPSLDQRLKQYQSSIKVDKVKIA